MDSRGAPANNSFVGYLNIPLRNVVKAELLTASVSANTQTAVMVYIYVDELVSKFNDRTQTQTAISIAGTTSNVGPNISLVTSNLSELSTSIVSFPADQFQSRSIFTQNGFWNTEVEFIEPIRLLPQLTVRVYRDAGDLLSLSGTTFLTLRFTCAKRNTCLY
jgi:hypothetical protein